ncbi:MLO-like protein 13 [Acorus calamus]|uniref:MLO-like protein 13 n=1 Tax=Acorus calamus TaxID=4465 RepID=A0AAV9CV25_ACOCL|nr:MLO-like protein 13 [Acorus calamus]
MVEGEAEGGDMEVLRESLEYTPTWVVATVCSIILIISLLVGRFLHYLGKNLISHICIPQSMTLHMLPCKLPGKEVHSHKSFSLGDTWTRRKLLSVGANSGYCKQGKVPLLSREALHHLHIFIFVLAVVHVIFCATTMLLAGAQIRKWKHWEESIRTNLRAPLKEDATPAHQHLQFANEHAGGFSINSMVTHCRGNPNFDFHNYMMKVLESDFKQVVGISVLIQVLCSYSTLPLYAIVTQMGSMFKRSMFEEHTHASLHGWAKGARKKIKDDRALLNVFGIKNKKNESSSDDQAQEMVDVSCEGSAKQHVALEEIVTSTTGECSNSGQPD